MAKKKAGIKIDCAYDKIVAVKELKPNPANPNIHSAEQIDKLALIIAAHGWRHPITVSNRSGHIVAGHCRLKAAQQIGAVTVPVDYQDFASDAEEKAVLVADNVVAELAETDYQRMGDILKGLKEFDYDLNLTALSPEQINDYLYAGAEAIEKEDEVPEPPKKAKTKTGDLYILGQHRLLCGDSTTRADVGRLMGKQKADMVFTDPPYAVKYTGGSSNKKKRTDTDWDEYTQEGYTLLIYGFLRITRIYVRAKSAYYIWFGDSNAWSLLKGCHQAHISERYCIIWRKLKPHYGALGRHYKTQHEPCLYAYQKGKSVNWYGANNEGTIWEFEQPRINELHPTQKPVALAERAIKNSSKHKEIVLDGFLGSGSTLIACEKLGRRCFGMEIDPLYCDVIVERWQKFTGKKAKRTQSKK